MFENRALSFALNSLAEIHYLQFLSLSLCVGDKGIISFKRKRKSPNTSWMFLLNTCNVKFIIRECEILLLYFWYWIRSSVADMDFFSTAALLHASNHRAAFSEHVFRWLKDMKVKICDTSAGNLVSLACTHLGALCTLDSSWITPVSCGKRLMHRSHEKALVPHWNFKWVKVSLWKSMFPKSIMKFEWRLDREYGSSWSFFISGTLIFIKLSFVLQQFDSFKLFS